MHIGANTCKVTRIYFFNLDPDLIAIGFSMILSLGGIWALSSGFDDDDDDENGGTGSPVFEPAYVGGTA